MKTIRPWMILICLAALMLVSGLAGVLIGMRMTQRHYSQQNNPETWHESAMRTFTQTVQPDAGQRDKIKTYLDLAVRDLQDIRLETIAKSSNIVLRLVGQVEKELTPEQRLAFEKMKPTRQDLSTLEVLQVDSTQK